MFLKGESRKMGHTQVGSSWGSRSLVCDSSGDQFIVTAQIEISSLRADASVNLVSFGEERGFRQVYLERSAADFRACIFWWFHNHSTDVLLRQFLPPESSELFLRRADLCGAFLLCHGELKANPHKQYTRHIQTRVLGSFSIQTSAFTYYSECVSNREFKLKDWSLCLQLLYCFQQISGLLQSPLSASADAFCLTGKTL